MLFFLIPSLLVPPFLMRQPVTCVIVTVLTTKSALIGFGLYVYIHGMVFQHRLISESLGTLFALVLFLRLWCMDSLHVCFDLFEHSTTNRAGPGRTMSIFLMLCKYIIIFHYYFTYRAACWN